MDRLSLLSDYAVSPFARDVNHTAKPRGAIAAVPYAERCGPVSKVAGNIEASGKQRLKDLERLRILQDGTSEESNDMSLISSTATANSDSKQLKPPNNTIGTSLSSSPTIVPEKFQNRQFSFANRAPQLSRDDFCIEVNVGLRQAAFSKQKALQVLKKNPLEKTNPNSTRGTFKGKRRAIDELNEKFMSNDAKRQKVEAEEQEAAHKSRLQRIMDATSSHSNLVAMREQEQQEEYFNKLEKKEALEEKMLNTFKMPCKAVICKTCKYTAFSAAEHCKKEKHVLKIVDAEKRFFQCKHCGERTATVFKLPKTSCKKCKSSDWQRTAMIRERKVGEIGLSVRGDEEHSLSSLATQANLNLLVPDES